MKQEKNYLTSVINQSHQVCTHCRVQYGQMKAAMFLLATANETENSCSETRLTQKDIVHLMELLQSHSYQWMMIGLSLGFLDPELTTILSKLRLLVGAPSSYLQELLSQWVQWPTASHRTKPTLESLCAALRSSLVGLGSLADKVNEEMRQTTGITQFEYFKATHNLVYSVSLHLSNIIHTRKRVYPKWFLYLQIA